MLTRLCLCVCPALLSLVWLTLPTPLIAQDATLEVGEGFGPIDGSATVAVTLKYDEPVTGWSFGICHDDGIAVAEDGVIRGEGLEDVDFDLHVIDIDPEAGWTAIATLTPNGNVLRAEDAELYLAEYELDEIGEFRVVPCDTLGDPEVEIVINFEDDEVTPDTIGGGIETRPIFVRGDFNGDGQVNIADISILCPFIVGGCSTDCLEATDANDDGVGGTLGDLLFVLNWLFGDEDAPPPPGPFVCGHDPEEETLGCDDPPACRKPADPDPDEDYLLELTGFFGVARELAPVRVLLSNNGDPVVAFQFSVCNDELLEVDEDSIQEGTALSGLEIFSSSVKVFSDEGWAVGVVLDTSEDPVLSDGPGTILPGDDLELYTAVYRMLDVGTASLEFCALGDPELKPLIVTRDEFIRPETEDAEVEIVDSTPFLRGDANGNGTVGLIADALYIFNYLFTEGPEPPCMDAADVNDNGEIRMRDGLFLLYYGFLSGDTPPAPGPLKCGDDEDPDILNCETLPDCP